MKKDTVFPFLNVFNNMKNSFCATYNAANLAKYLKAPMLIIESLYDQFSVDEIVVTECKS